jgi:ribosomal protein S18 acetylase RimI-like enzyme
VKVGIDTKFILACCNILQVFTTVPQVSCSRDYANDYYTDVTIYLFPDLTEYQLVTGTAIDVTTLLKFLQVTYQELYPHQQDYRHLQSTVDRYFSAETPLWFVITAARDPSHEIACLWLGMAIDQVTGIRHPNIFLIYVDPAYRRQGIGKALMGHAEAWAKAQGYTQMGLQVFTTNQSAIELYQQLGYQSRSISMIREL